MKIKLSLEFEDESFIIERDLYTVKKIDKLKKHLFRKELDDYFYNVLQYIIRLIQFYGEKNV